MGVFEASTSPAKERYAVTDANVVKLLQPGSFADPLTEVLRNGARACWPRRSRPRWPISSPSISI